MKRDWKAFLFAARIWQPMTDFWARTTDWPIVGRGFSYILNDRHYDVTYIPINQELEESESTVVPKQVVYEMIERSCHRVILTLCMCRLGCRCEDHPIQIGCIYMGESAKDIDPSLGKAVSVEEAKAHVDRGIEAGLIPQIGRVDPDPLMMGLKDFYHILTLCFCCPCCCIAMRNMPRWSQRVKDRMHMLDGLRIEVTEDCNNCGKCVKECFAQAIVMDGQNARITDACKGCGICASICPENAISISVTDGDRMLSEAFRRIESFTDVTSGRGSGMNP